jgi:tryptophan synthase alpha chain
MTQGGDRITSAIVAARNAGRAAIAAYVTAGFPARETFPALLREVSTACDILEIGIPFSDPMADGATIQRASRIALVHGTTLTWTLQTLAETISAFPRPVVIMSYLNPLLAYGTSRLARDAAAAGVAGFIVPDLPLEEQERLRPLLGDAGLAFIQMVTPATPAPRLTRIGAAADGFVYAVTVTGTTGGRLGAGSDLTGYLERTRAATTRPLLAGFGVRTRDDVAAAVPPADGVVVGSALIAAIERGESPSAFLAGLLVRPSTSAGARP